MHQGDVIVFTLTVLSSVASVGACTWLLWKVPSTCRRLLLPNQLVNLARADLLASTMRALQMLVNPNSPELAGILYSMSLLGLMTSVLLEVHIAMGFVAVYWRMPRLLQFLKRTTSFTWVVSLPMVVLYFVWLAGILSTTVMWEDLYFYVLVAACVSTLALYVTAWIRSWFFPLREAQRAHRMVWLYPAAFIITVVPSLVHDRGIVSTPFGAPFTALNGLVNVLIYS